MRQKLVEALVVLELFAQYSSEPHIATSSREGLDDVFANVALLME